MPFFCLIILFISFYLLNLQYFSSCPFLFVLLFLLGPFWLIFFKLVLLAYFNMVHYSFDPILIHFCFKESAFFSILISEIHNCFNWRKLLHIIRFSFSVFTGNVIKCDLKNQGS